MKNNKLSKDTIKIINNLKDDLDKMLVMDSNIEVIWEMEKLQNEKAFKKSADFIRKSLN